MNTFLEVDCQDINLIMKDEQIIITVKTKVKVYRTGNTQKENQIVNSHLLAEKGEEYQKLFKSKVVVPPPIQHEQSVIPETGAPQQKENQIGNNSGNEPPRQQSIFTSARPQENLPSSNSANIFNSSQPESRSTAGSSIFGRTESRQISQTNQSNWRNNSFFTSSKQPSSNTNQNNSGQGNSSVFNISGSSSAANLFMMPSHSQPSLFDAQPQGQSVTSSRRGGTRVGRGLKIT